MDFRYDCRMWMEIRRIKRPQRWWKPVVLAILAAAILLLGSELVVEPIAHRIWPEPENVSNVIQSGGIGLEAGTSRPG